MQGKNALSEVLGPVLVLIVGSAVAIMLTMTPGGGGHSNKLPPWWIRDSAKQAEHHRKQAIEPRLEQYRKQAQSASERSALGSAWSDHAGAERTLNAQELRSNLLVLTAILASGSRRSTNP